MATTPESTIFLKVLSSNHLTVIISFQRGKINYRKTLPEKKIQLSKNDKLDKTILNLVK